MARFINKLDSQTEENTTPMGFSSQKLEDRVQGAVHEQSFVMSFYQRSPVAFTLAVLVVVGGFMAPFLKDFTPILKTSLVDIPSVPWVGTVMPLKEVSYRPNMTAEDRLLPFSALPAHKKTTLPEYNPSLFQKGLKNPSFTEGLQAFLTWTVPHGGNYQLDGTEMSGSHPGVDISTNEGTPVYSMAAGVVTKVDYQPSGFGNVIVITHPNVPDPNNASELTTLRSVYGHLAEKKVKIGEVVQKGQFIGTVGSTGTATANHLHWQIERAIAPYQGYWPFTMTEARSAGINSFFEAVKQGFGKENMKKYTTNPAAYVNQWKNVSVASNGSLDGQIVPLVAKNIGKNEEIGYVPIETEPVYDNPSVMGFDMVIPSDFTVNKPNTFTAMSASKFAIGTGVSLRTNLGSAAEISPIFLRPDDFNDAFEATFTISSKINKDFTIIAEGAFGQKTFDVKVKPKVAELPVVLEQKVEAVEKEPVELFVEDKMEEKEKVSSENNLHFTDLGKMPLFASSVRKWANKGVVKGYDNGNFHPEWNVNRAEALKMLMLAFEIPAESGTPFVDVPRSAWFSGYIAAAVKKGIVKGYENNLFKPAQNVSRAEFVKMAAESAQAFVPPVSTSRPIAPDVPATAWYARYMAWGLRHKVFSGNMGAILAPNEAITRGEAMFLLDRIYDASL